MPCTLQQIIYSGLVGIKILILTNQITLFSQQHINKQDTTLYPEVLYNVTFTMADTQDSSHS